MRSRPRLCIVHAWMLFLTGRLDAVEPRLRDAERALRDLGPEVQDELLGMVATIRASLASIQDDAPRAIALSREALERLPEQSAHWRSQSSISLGIALDSSGNVAGAIQAFDDAAAISQHAGNTFQAMIALWSLAVRQIMRGRLRQAEWTYRRALHFARERGEARLPATALAHIGLGDLLRERNDLQTAERHLREGLELGRQGGNFGTRLGAHMGLARVLQAQGAADAARDALRPAEDLVRKSNTLPLYVVWLAATRARLWLAQGNLTDAVRWAEEYGPGADEELARLGTHVRNLTLFTLARVYIARGSAGARQALPMLERMQHVAESEGRTGVVIEALTLQALALAACGDASQAISALQRALVLAEPEGYVRLFVDEGVLMAVLLQHIVKRGISTQYARKLLATFQQPAEGPGLRLDEASTPSRGVTQLLPEPLSERELEVLRLIASGRSNREIASDLYISLGTVKTHINNTYRKLGAHSRTRALTRARDLNLI